MVLVLRSGWTLRYGRYNIDDCITFLNGPYPNLSRFSLIELRQFKYKIEDSYVIIQNEILDSREEIEDFLIRQWRGNQENLVSCSTPRETSTYEVICNYCNVRNCETDSEDEDIKLDDEFLCHICGQFDCIKYGFRGPGFSVHSPHYGTNYSHFRRKEYSHGKSLKAYDLYRKSKSDYISQKYAHLMLDIL
jgi:hypothetical protein